MHQGIKNKGLGVVLFLQPMWRRLYYLLSPAWRLAARWLRYLPYDLLHPPPPMVPPRRLMYTGRGDFVRQGEDWLRFFQDQGLQTHHYFLDVGSGIGRIARPLTQFLSGPYEGFDVVEMGVRWCQRHITSRYPQFHFRHVRLHNDLYTADGLAADRFKFPYDAATFDFGCAISVFTHLLPAETRQYLHETARVMKPGGRFVATFFLLTGKESEVRGSFSFPHNFGHYGLMDLNVQRANVAYSPEFLEEACRAAGWRVRLAVPGSWRGIPPSHPVAFQDVWVLEKEK